MTTGEIVGLSAVCVLGSEMIMSSIISCVGSGLARSFQPSNSFSSFLMRGVRSWFLCVSKKNRKIQVRVRMMMIMMVETY